MYEVNIVSGLHVLSILVIECFVRCTTSSNPFYVVSNPACRQSSEGFVCLTVISQVLNTFLNTMNATA